MDVKANRTSPCPLHKGDNYLRNLNKDFIFTGYGFTDEEDYVHLIDKETGDRILTRKVDKAPSYFSVIED